MTDIRPPLRILNVILATIMAVIPALSVPARAGNIPLPAALAQKLSAANDAASLAAAFLGIAYVDDATVDETGHFTLFEHPETILAKPGLNCSGFVLSVSRFLLQKNFSLAAATADTGRDSGPDAPLGRDWDFGFDLIRNISNGLPRRVILPGGETPDPATADGLGLRGFPIADTAAWRSILPRLKPGHVYLASFSKPVDRKPYRLLHYHVGLILPDPDGGAALYHATPRSGSHRISLATAKGLKQFQDQFSDKTPGEKYILLLEVPLAIQ